MPIYRLGAEVSVPTGAGRARARIVARTERVDGPPLYEVETVGCVRARMTVAESDVALC